MKEKIILLFICLISIQFLQAQNVGIGTNAPGFPLNFANTSGDKISLFGNSGPHYGFGIQNSLLQIHTDLQVSNIAFGYGTSNAFTERMVILNNGGYDGMSLNGRLVLKNGSTDLVGGGAGVWLYKANNSSLLGFMGTQNNQNIGFYGGPNQWGFTYNALNSMVGIGNNNPDAPLSFGATLGKKITFYPGTLGNAGIGIAGNRLQIYSDNPNADVAIGYDAAGTFNEKFAVKPTGALAVSGNVGAPGQTLTSNGNGGAYWSTPGAYNIVYQSVASVDAVPNQAVDVPGLEANFTLATNAQVVFNLRIGYNTNYCLACSQNQAVLSLYKNIVGGTELVKETVGGGHGYPWTGNTLTSGPIVVNLTSGTYSYKVVFKNWGVMAHEVGYDGNLTWQVFPQ